MTIAIGCDHAGYDYKEEIKKYLDRKKIKVVDMGTQSTDSVDYPDFVHPVANYVEGGKDRMGILICGSGNGVSITANKHKGIRAALCWKIDLAILGREHNDANILSIPARFVSLRMAKRMVGAFISTPFAGGRHQRRVDKISHC